VQQRLFDHFGTMKWAKQEDGRQLESTKTAASVLASVSFPPEFYRTLEEISEQTKFSLAWVVRAAAEPYVTEKWIPYNESPQEEE
jgi:hypothetical protein